MSDSQVIDVIKDRDGSVFYSWLSEDHVVLTRDQAPRISENYQLFLTNDFRSIRFCQRLVDVNLLFKGENFKQLILGNLKGDLREEYREALGKVNAHLLAAHTAQIPEDVSIVDLLPPELLQRYLVARGKAIKGLLDLALSEDPGALTTYFTETLPFARTLRDIELSKIKVDRPKAEGLVWLADSSLSVAERRFVNSVRSLADSEGFAEHVYDARPGRTGRVQTKRGLNVMAIPHGICRTLLPSRFKGGKILVLDFNAIDYRCIVNSIPIQSFRDHYRGCQDFHRQSALFLVKEPNDIERQAVKHLTYIYIYGGSAETIAEKVGMTVEKVNTLLGRLDRHLKPIADFRAHLYEQAQLNGYVELPTGRKVKVSKDDHPGKVLGLYAQSYSSHVFATSIQYLMGDLGGPVFRQSKMLFTVHDELVIDLHPEELGDVERAIQIMQSPWGNEFIVKGKMGENYEEASAK